MKGSRTQILRQPILVAAAVSLGLSAIFVGLEWYGPIPQPGVALEGKLTQVQNSAIDLIVDLAKLFMGWSLAVIGGAGYFLKANIERDYPLTRLGLSLAEAIIVASVVSIFYGHLTINFIVTMLTLDVMSLVDPALALYIRIQYLAFLLSLLLFAAYIHSIFFQRSSSVRSIPKNPEKKGH